MKRCPQCGTTYTDDSLRYCLQDGTLLSGEARQTFDPEATLVAGEGRSRSDAPPTEILNPDELPTARIRAGAPTEPQRARPTERATSGVDASNIPPTIAAVPPVAVAPPTIPRRTSGPVIALSILVAVLLLALGGIIAWVMMRDSNGESTRVTNTTSNQSSASRSPESNTRTNPTPASSASPTPQASPVDTAAVLREVDAALNGWADSIRQRDINKHMSYYADRLEVFYNSSNVNADRVRAAREDAFSRYDTMDVKLSKIRTEVNDTGTRATATFDKTFNFEGEKNFSGAVESRLSFVKTGGRWRIVGEKDLRTYYVNK